MIAEVRSHAVVRALVRLLPSFEEEMLLLPEFVRPGDVCLDIGASYGLYAVALARQVGPHGRVHAFEPRPRSRAILGLVSRALAPGNIAIHTSALGARDGDDVIVTPRRRWGIPVPGRSFLRGQLRGDADGGYFEGWRDEFGAASEHHVVVRELDPVLEESGLPRVAFVKIDVEGAEMDVLLGGRRMIERDRPTVLCELEERHTDKYGHRADDVLTWFVDQGYSAHRLDGRVLRPVDRVHPSTINYVFLPQQEPGSATSKP